MSAPFLGMIITVGFNFAPRGWAFCNGQLLPIAQNTALFSLLGTTYGGNGQTTFALPDLRSRVPIHTGQGPGLSNYVLGQQGGQESIALTVNEMPLHQHGVAATGTFTTKNPGGQVPAPGGAYGSPPDATTMDANMIRPAGGSQPHANIQPYLTINFCISLEGIYPSRN
jgi:microcystin-dependent protein